MNELISNIEVNITPAVISFDLTPIKALVSTLTASYTGWVVREDDLKAASDTIAQINKVSKALSDKRIAIGKEYKKPYESFENEIKNMTVELEVLSKSIKSQTDIYEQQRQDEKRTIILSLPNYNEHIAFDEKWLNKGAKIEDIAFQIEAQNNQRLVIEHEIKDLCGQEIDSTRFLEMYHNGTSVDLVKQIIDGALKALREPKPKDDPFFAPEDQPTPQKSVELMVSTELFGTQNDLRRIKNYAQELGIKIVSWTEV